MSPGNPSANSSSTRQRTWLRLAAAWSLVVCGHAAAVGGEELYLSYRCDGCHGRGGRYPALPLYPRINGQNAAYLLQQMRDIREGARSNAMSAAMRATVTKVTDEELGAIAQWLADQ